MKIFSPAKINLFLQVTGKRPDGYHELVTLMSCISLYDVMTIDFEMPGISVRCDSPEVPDNEGNLAFKAASLFYDRLSTARREDHIGSGRNGGVSIFIEKQIPVAAGLGGGSSNAGRTLLQLNQLIRTNGIFQRFSGDLYLITINIYRLFILILQANVFGHHFEIGCNGIEVARILVFQKPGLNGSGRRKSTGLLHVFYGKLSDPLQTLQRFCSDRK